MKRLLFVNIILLTLCYASCSKEVRLKAPAIEDRSTTPVLDVGGVTTLISDSGIVRYRITADSWMIYDKAETPYWEFAKGVYLEKFNEAMNVEASLKADYAKYESEAERWELKGNVVAVNEVGEQFETPQLYWNQQTEQIYSDSSITITRATSVIMGIGFRSNQTMTQYTILQPTGFFPIQE